MKKVLLHICCGVCAWECINRLKEEGYYIEAFFYNPNIHPSEEYYRRWQAAEFVCSKAQIKIWQGKYNPLEDWFSFCRQYADQPEGGKRCSVCFYLRLKATAQFALQRQIYNFTTTLTISPYKKSKEVFKQGQKCGEKINFLAYDFKKKDGYLKTCKASKENNIYRQHYCGCVYSLLQRRQAGKDKK